MAALVSALDNLTLNPPQLGENGHREHAWSSNIQELILQLSFQLTRTKDTTQIAAKCRELLTKVFETTDDKNREYISILFRMMLQTRDIVAGKGEYLLFYTLLGEWVRFSHTNNNDIASIFSLAALHSLVELDGFKHAYGSWKDFKYFLNYLRDNVATETEKETFTTWPICKYAITLMTLQLQKDAELLTGNSSGISLLAKWLPREKSKPFGWIAKLVACNYFKKWIQVNANNPQAEKKCLTHYRTLIASINKHLQTVQVNQCGKTWHMIDFDKSVTSITLSRQKRAFQYVNKNGTVRGTDEDRLLCKKNFEAYVESCTKGEKTIKGNRVGINELVKEAQNILARGRIIPQGVDVDTLNLQWKEQGKQIGKLDNFIAMVDTSGSMTGDPIFAAIGLGCRVAEKSKLGKRVLTFSATPSWVNLEAYTELVDMVSVLQSSQWGMNTNFVSALKLILDACIDRDLPPEEVSELALVVFSDMQIDAADSNSNSMHDTITQMFYSGGMRTSHRKPYTPPHIVFWNLRSTNGFPSMSTTKNVSMLSGFSATLLNVFCEKGMDGLKNLTPWNTFLESLEHERYAWAKHKIMTKYDEARTLMKI
jgi:hypothetical protein